MFDVQWLATTVSMTIGFINALPPREIASRLRKFCAKRAGKVRQ